MSEEISREEIAALLARESEEMTRERAIGVITLHREHWQRLMKGNVCSKQEGEESIAAFDVALAALSAEPCENAISRQEAIEAIRKDPMGGLNYEGILTRLPSVTPKLKPCDDAISRTRAMETFAHWAEHKDYTHVERHILHAVVDELRAMPSISDKPDEWTPILKDLYNGLEEGS